MPNINQYKRIIGELCRLHAEEKRKRHREHRIFKKSTLAFLQEVIALHRKENKKLREEYIIPFIKSYPYLNQPSSLKVIEKLYHETYHSLFLKHIWDSQTSNGSAMFVDFLKETGFNEPWINTIRQNNYHIECEHCILHQEEQHLNQKRIDLLFVDKTNKWVVVIENKINSEVRVYSDSHDTQLDAYRNYCRRERRFRGFTRRHILLSYNRKNACYAEESKEWKNADYYQVFKSLLKYASTDALIADYAKTLFSILFPQENLQEADCDLLHRNALFYNRVISKLQ